MVPFIDFLVAILAFLILHFSPAPCGETAHSLPNARHGIALEVAPILTVDERNITLDGIHIAAVETVARSPLSIPPLVQSLEQLRRNWAILHPAQPFPAAVIVQADVDTDFGVIRSLMRSAQEAGYGHLNFAVNRVNG